MESTAAVQAVLRLDLGEDTARRPHMAKSTGYYRETPVRGAMADVFVCRWQHRAAPPGTDVPASNVVPDACVDLIWANGRLHVAGPDRVFQSERVAQGGVLAGLRFHPGHASAWLGLPVSEIVNCRLPLADLWGSDAHRIEDEVATAESNRAPELALQRVLASWPPRAGDVDCRWKALPGLLHTAAMQDAPVVPWLMSEFGLSERTLRRQVEEAFGYGPKTLDRILRFQRFLQLAKAGEQPSLARLAVAAGYADQAHLTRECRRLAGLTPRQIVDDLRRRSR